MKFSLITILATASLSYASSFADYEAEKAAILAALAKPIAERSPEPLPEPDEDDQLTELYVRQGYIGQICTNRSQGNLIGTCQTTTYCSNQAGFADPLPDCPGPDNIQCCVLDDCVNGADGFCRDRLTVNCPSGMHYDSGNYCPGPDRYQCCRYN